jgi:two-component system LytT family response regulator
MKIIIIDDERLARKEIRRLLGNIPDIEVSAEASNIDQAEQLISEHQPDLLLLDISMPGGNGFDLLSRLEISPPVIFTTAHDEHAIKAFEVSAFDYLLKPIDPTRFKKSITEAKNRLATARSENQYQQRIYVKDGDDSSFIRISEIEHIESIGNYVRIYFGYKKPMLKRPLSHMESILPYKNFIRANRSHIINTDFIDNISTEDGAYITATLKSGVTIKLSRRQSKWLKERWSI